MICGLYYMTSPVNNGPDSARRHSVFFFISCSIVSRSIGHVPETAFQRDNFVLPRHGRFRRRLWMRKVPGYERVHRLVGVQASDLLRQNLRELGPLDEIHDATLTSIAI